MTTRHTIVARPKVNVECAGAEDTLRPEITITFDYAPAKDDSVVMVAHAAYDSLPQAREEARKVLLAYDEDITFIEARMTDSDGLDPTQEQINNWAEDWLYGTDGYDAALSIGRSAQS